MARPNNQALGNRLRELREATGLSLRKFADELSKHHTQTHSSVWNLEQGNNGPSPSTIRAYCAVCGLSAEDADSLTRLAGFVVSLPSEAA